LEVRITIILGNESKLVVPERERDSFDETVLGLSENSKSDNSNSEDENEETFLNEEENMNENFLPAEEKAKRDFLRKTGLLTGKKLTQFDLNPTKEKYQEKPKKDIENDTELERKPAGFRFELDNKKNTKLDSPKRIPEPKKVELGYGKVPMPINLELV